MIFKIILIAMDISSIRLFSRCGNENETSYKALSLGLVTNVILGAETSKIETI